ncbi:HPr family phosphocarrier protein [Alicyclobacillus fastidiosus]|uniref:Phosphocarrier protein HPr n=1 Tax=Alicyclobacillus fastidiosus TaxID=392011 RepID=A0ABY6ZE65_9BACL|nr:HPr family phosphocarrier protein [Alicyclobacillus fastidiosus]WAH41146.1 HPr family phosphocarrier protein [Alicyclobacillus fastidiosus]GMA62708.1 HPr-like protein Crh [Alicyclobacillus fastidiosus]
MQEQSVTISNASGLHARPASLFVNKAAMFESKITLEKDGKAVDAKSILGIMSMAVTSGSVVTIRAEGPDEAAAVSELAALIDQLDD